MQNCEVRPVMSEKIGVEIERKFVVEKPNIALLEKIEGYTRSEILQIYLDSAVGETRRIRRRIFKDKTFYSETRKIRLDKLSATENERSISPEEFEELRRLKKSGTEPVNKIRHTFPYRGHVFEIDVYPQWKRSSVMEVEMDSRTEEVKLPPFVKIIREVTGNREYSNASMSRSFPDEDK